MFLHRHFSSVLNGALYILLATLVSLCTSSWLVPVTFSSPFPVARRCGNALWLRLGDFIHMRVTALLLFHAVREKEIAYRFPSIQLFRIGSNVLNKQDLE